MNKLLVASALAIFLSGCATDSTEPAKTETAGPSAEQTAAADAISAAKANLAEAKKNGWVWRDTGKVLKKAEEAFKAGDYAKASKLAAEVSKQSELAVNQYYMEEARFLINELDARGNVPEDAAKNLQAAKEMLAQHQGRWAYDLASAAYEQANANTNIEYTVVKGDSLWRISGKDSIYGNPYQWPLIYKANASKIKDADLIYPGQNFDINANPSSGDVAAAVSHAKSRGAWSVGAVEASDQAYLGN